MHIAPRAVRGALTTAAIGLVAVACSPAIEPRSTPPSGSAPAAATVSASPSVAASGTATVSPSAGPAAFVFEAKRLGGVYLGGDQPSVTFVGDGAFVVEAAGVAELCDLASWKSVRSLPTGLSSWVASADGKVLAALEDDETVLVDAATGKERGRLSTGAGTLALSQDGASLVVVKSIAFDKFRGTVWATAAGAASPPRRVDGAQSGPGTLGTIIGPDRAAFLASAEPSGPALTIETRPPHRLDLEPPIRFTFAPDGSAAVVSGRKADKLIAVVLDLPDGKERARFEVAPPAAQAAEGSPPYVHTLSASRRAARIALTVGPANGPGALVVVDGRTGASLARHEQAENEQLESSTLLLAPDGKHALWIRRQPATAPPPAGAAPKSRPFEIAMASVP